MSEKKLPSSWCMIYCAQTHCFELTVGTTDLEQAAKYMEENLAMGLPNT